MNKAEKDLMEIVDKKITNASAFDLKHIQELDKRTQLSGISFYDVFVSSIKSIPEKEKLPSNFRSPRKLKKK